MEFRPASLYRAISIFNSKKKKLDNYNLLPSYLNAFCKKNPGSQVSPQFDEFRRFLRIPLDSIHCKKTVCFDSSATS
ncbi:hypothetical protein PHMEG_0006117 [Phytophthora megakarya]|uniref:Uncharacterized protein n=1 Tax=Phytophthora megakarya TaxID=4795 RepID=A0A225WRD0_9STRA|nr:hypothetical protein PHMEG_0006117 [Phytophthora megakarya]